MAAAAAYARFYKYYNRVCVRIPHMRTRKQVGILMTERLYFLYLAELNPSARFEKSTEDVPIPQMHLGRDKERVGFRGASTEEPQVFPLWTDSNIPTI